MLVLIAAIFAVKKLTIAVDTGIAEDAASNWASKPANYKLRAPS